LAEHREWLDALSIRSRCAYDRAYGKQWFHGGANKEACRAAGHNAVVRHQEKLRAANA